MPKPLFNTSRPSSRRGTPKPLTRTPRPSPPRPSTGDGAMLAGAASAAAAHQLQQQPSKTPPEGTPGRPLNVADALSYLDAVKVQFQDKPDVYNHFLDIMKDFKSQVIDTPGVIDRVSMLFHGNPLLIEGFNTFLPPGYHISISADPRDPNMITVTTPSGTTTQPSNAFGQMARRAAEPPARDLATIASQFGPPLGSGSGSRSMTPNAFHLTQMHSSAPFDNMSTGYASPGFPVSSTNAAASFLNTLNNNNNRAENRTHGEFNHAIQYLNKIKARYSDDPNTYKQFLEILQAYQKEQRHLQDSQVYVQVQILFKDAPDLLGEFKDFLPEVLGVGSAASGTIGILPQPSGMDTHGPSWSKPEVGLASDREKTNKRPAASKRRKRPVEPEIAPVPPVKASSSRAKKAKHHHKPDPSPPASIHTPPSPHAHLHPHGHVLSAQPSQQGPNAHPLHATGSSGAHDELLFFDRAKRALEPQESWEEFLKLLNLFSRDIIDGKVLVDKAQVFLGDGELLAQFRDLMGFPDKNLSSDQGPPGSVRTGPPEALAALPADDGQGPSYRRLPESEVHLACSGRDQLCRSVLNDEWVSHPTWASEEAGFVTHKKNTFEDALHKSEEERYEYHVHIEALTRTIAVFEPLSIRIDEMSPEERTAFRLGPDFGGPGKQIYHRIIKKIYGRDAGSEVIQALQESPGVSVPVVLARLKKKDEEWRRARRDWSRMWREVDAKNFYKSLDHQGISFKANDKKAITAKHLVGDIESVKARQATERASRENPLQHWAHGSLGFQLEYGFDDTSVLQDSLKMVYSFLDHSHAQYSLEERRSVETFLRSFVPLLCTFPSGEFNDACGPLDGAPDINAPASAGKSDGGGSHSGGIVASDLRKKLLKTVQEKTVGQEPNSTIASQAGSLTPESPRLSTREDEPETSVFRANADDVWIRANLSGEQAVSPPMKSRPIFVNTTYYTLLRLLQLLYSRLLMCKTIGEALAHDQHRNLLANPIAVDLGMDEPNGPPAVLAQAIDALGEGASANANVVYMYLLDACEKVFDNELDQATFEEHMRWFFGNKAFHVFTLDKLITALVKQVQTVLSDNKCQELWTMMQDAHSAETGTLSQRSLRQSLIRYRREAERHAGSDDHLYRVEWVRRLDLFLKMRIQLLGVDDPSIEADRSEVNRWQEYSESYAMCYETEWVPSSVSDKPPFLRRCLPAEDQPSAGAQGTSGLAIRISLGTYKLFYERGTEDVLLQATRPTEGLQERVRRREEERRRSRWLL
ncbi:hypothetical protein PLICRDRAFT_99544 [Plicaturopsis crispa FD-325 SS-3]|nr:hypothetical protein PLICRDRAFT_99544 [Plicaturopsis crispa FD-325 SS-3]